TRPLARHPGPTGNGSCIGAQFGPPRLRIPCFGERFTVISPQNQHPPFSPPPPGLGSEALRLGPARIHSRHRPGTEILPQLDAIPAGRAPLVLLGFGAGFHLPFIREKFPNRRLIVIEPHPAVIAYLKSPDAPSLALNQNEELYG